MYKLIIVALVSLLSSAVFGFFAVKILKKIKFSQTILGYVSEHRQKNGTPTMGGFIFVLPTIVVFLIFSDGNRLFSFVSLAAFALYAIVGFADDFIKIRYRDNQGLTPAQKLIFQFLIAVIATVFICRMGLTEQYIPFFNVRVDFGWWFLPLGVFIFLAGSNCVNLTDGLDGLAGTTSAVYLLFTAVIVYLQSSTLIADKGTYSEYENLSLLAVSGAFSLIGYLLYNTNKASVFMGDTGSLALGGLIACLSMVSGNAFLVATLGIVFVASGVSVIIQVLYYKRTKKRVFLMAPVHHHFQEKGYAESKIVFAYKAVTVVMGLLLILGYLGD